MVSEDRRWSVPGYVAGLVCAGVVVAMPLVAGLIDHSADEFGTRHFSTVPALGWVVCAVLGAVVVTRRLQIVLSVEEGSVLAVAYDALPILLVAGWIVAVAAAVSGHWLLAIAAGGLCVDHVIIIVPRLITARRPSWTRKAPTVELVVANVFVDNVTPIDAARQLVAAGGDVVVA